MALLGNTNNVDILINTISNLKGIAETEGAMGGLTDKAAFVGKAMLAMGAVVAGVGVAAVQMASTFQSKMELIRTQAGASQQEVDSMSKSVLGLAKSSEFGPDKLSDALYHLESVGLRGADAMAALKAASDGASVGHANLESVTNALAGALKSGIKGTEDMGTTMATLNAIVGAGNMRMDDLASAMGTGFLPAAKNFGISIQDAGAALAELTRTGSGADESATRLRMTFAMLAAPSSRASAIFDEIGLKQGQLATDMREKGLIPALQDLRDHLIKTYGTTEEGKTKIAEALSHAFGGGRSSAAILTLIQNLDDLKGTYAAVQDGTKNFADDVAARHAELSFKISELWSSVQSILITLGRAIIPPVIKALDYLVKAAGAVGRAFDWKADFEKATSAMKDLWKGFKEVADRVEDYLGPKFGSLWKVIRDDLMPTLNKLWHEVIEPLLPIIGTVLVFAIGLLIDALKELIRWWSKLIDWTLEFKDVSTKAWDAVYKAARIAIDSMAPIFQWIGDRIQNVKDWFDGLPAPIRQAVSGVADIIIGPFRTAFDYIRKGFDDINRAIGGVKGFTSGGASGVLKDAVSSLFHIPTFASGTSYAPGGLSLVGENGPELVNLPRGAQVKPAGETKRLLQSSRELVINQTNNIFNQVDMAAANRELGFRLANA